MEKICVNQLIRHVGALVDQISLRFSADLLVTLPSSVCMFFEKTNDRTGDDEAAFLRLQEIVCIDNCTACGTVSVCVY